MAGTMFVDRPPGPRNGEIPGAAPFAADRTSFLVAGTARYGDVWAIRPGVYVVAGAELTREVFRRTGKGFGVLEGAFADPPVEHRGPQAGSRFATATVRGLRPAAVGERAAVLAAEAAVMAEGWPQDQEVDVLPRINRAVSRMGAQYYFGPDAPALTHAENDLARLRTKLTHRYLHLPSWVPSPSRMRVYRCHRRLAGRILDVIDQRLTEGRQERDLLAAAMRAAHPDGHRIAYGLASLMVAAQEMPTRATGWVMAELARHPWWADRIAAEAGRLPENPAEIDAGHLTRLRYADAFVREALRLYPTTWLISRSITAPTELGGYRLHPGDQILISPYLLHHDRRYFTEPDAFWPQRWLTPDTTDHHPAYLPFGAGPRMCPGAALATTEMILITAMTTRRHLLSCATTTPYRLDAKGALTPAGLRLVFRRRG